MSFFKRESNYFKFGYQHSRLPATPPARFGYYHCVEDYFEAFTRNYDENYSRAYGFWQPYIEKVIRRYPDCGDLHQGFARVKCKDCGH